MSTAITVPEAVTRALALLESTDGRVVIGLAGAPGAGKSTVAAALVEAVPGAVIVPMDGYHLAHSVLTARGDVEAKGAPQTFDADGYVALLQRIRAGSPRTIWAPEFRREIEDGIAGALAVQPDTRLVITEGNYLLLAEEPWAQVRELCDEVWFVEPAEQLRVERLAARHVQFGRSEAEALARATTGTDGANAALVLATRERADVIVTND